MDLAAAPAPDRAGGPLDFATTADDAAAPPDLSSPVDAESGDAELPDLLPPPDLTPPPDLGPPPRPFEWVAILGTGQSLSVGATSTPVISVKQPYGNLKLSDPRNGPMKPLPLVEPIRALSGGAYPANIAGETGHTAMANQLSVLSLGDEKRDYPTLHSVVGVGGQSINYLKKGGTGNSYVAGLDEAKAFLVAATAAKKSLGYGAIVLTHGETDWADANYGKAIRQLWLDYNADLKAITRQVTPIPLLLTQQGTFPGAAGRAASTLLEWKLGVDYPGEIVCVGPKYQYFYSPDHVHLTANGSRRMGEKYAEVFYQLVVRGRAWRPLQPSSAKQNGATITVGFDIPVPPLNWDLSIAVPHQSVNKQWAAGRGFEAEDSNGPLTITDVQIVGDAVVIKLAAAPTGKNLLVRYAMTQDGSGYAGGTALGRQGQLRDSDLFVGQDAQKISCVVTQNSVVVTSVAANGFAERDPGDVVVGAALGAGTTMNIKHAADKIQLSQPWSGASATVDLDVHSDQHNYCVQFELPVS